MRRKSAHRTLVETVYDTLADANKGKTSLAEVEAEVGRRLTSGDWDAIKADYITGLVRSVDDIKQAQASNLQLSLWDAAPQFLDGFWSIGGGKRVRVRKALWTDMQLHLKEIAANAAEVNASAARKQQEAADLTPYFVTPTTIYEEALDGWKRDHPRRKTI